MLKRPYNQNWRRIKSILSRYGVTRDKMRPKADLTHDLGFRFYDRASLAMDLEAELHKRVDVDNVYQLRTLNDLVHWVYQERRK